MNLKCRLADFKVWSLNNIHRAYYWVKHFVDILAHDLKQDENHDLRLFVFVFVYIVFSAVGAYNFAHLAAFLYIVWLLERRHGN